MAWINVTYNSATGSEIYPALINIDQLRSIGRHADGRAVLRWADPGYDALVINETFNDITNRSEFDD